MIYTVTLNPSIDYIVRLDSLVPGITNRTTAEEYYYGGKGINVSCVLAELDLESTAFGFVAGFTGDAIEKGIRNDRIITDFIKLESGISRINIKIKAGVETEINCQGPHISEGELERLFDRLLLETDAPYMAPVPFRGKRCDSSMIIYAAEKIASLRNISISELLQITCDNAKRFYNIDD